MKFDPPLLHPNSAYPSFTFRFPDTDLFLHPPFAPPLSFPRHPDPSSPLPASTPTVYANGEVCISILHAPGDDATGYESASERWSPVQSVEKILLSVISMLAEPNLESGANIDACVGFRFPSLPQRRSSPPPPCRSAVLSSLYSCTDSRPPQKLYRDNREDYDETIRAFVRQQLDL